MTSRRLGGFQEKAEAPVGAAKNLLNAEKKVKPWRKNAQIPERMAEHQKLI